MQRWDNLFLMGLILLWLQGSGSQGGIATAVAGEGAESMTLLNPTGLSDLPKEGSQSLPMMEMSLEKQSPLYIDSKEMTVKGQEGRVLFEGGVKIQRGDVTMKAEHAEVFLADSRPDLKNEDSPPSMHQKQVRKIEVTRNVELRQGTRRVVAQRGTYDAMRQELVFSGEPEMWEEGYTIKGKVIKLSLAQKRSVIEGSQLIIN